MSAVSVEIGATGTTRSIDRYAENRLRRAMLIAVRDEALLQDQIECAELALAAGLTEAAEALYGLVFLQLGFSSAGLTIQRQIRQRAGLWPDMPERKSVPTVAGFCVDVAVAELRQLMRLHPALPATTGHWDATLPDDIFAPEEPSPIKAGELARLSAQSIELLRAIARMTDNEEPANILRGLAGDVVVLAPILLHEKVGRDLAELAGLYALERLRRFLLSTHEILAVDTPDTPLFDQVARLDPTALGPYFSNVRLVMRNARDIFALIELAAEGTPTYQEIECWSALLSVHLSRSETLDLVDELGDRGMGAALQIVLARTARSGASDRPRDIVWRIRDVALDVGDKVLAGNAQQVIALWARTDANEWLILGTIRGASGETVAAQAALSRALLLEPDRSDVRDRVAELRSGARFTVDKGYGTSPGRLRLRRARLRAFGRAT